jgi:hypothetical protein
VTSNARLEQFSSNRYRVRTSVVSLQSSRHGVSCVFPSPLTLPPPTIPHTNAGRYGDFDGLHVGDHQPQLRLEEGTDHLDWPNTGWGPARSPIVARSGRIEGWPEENDPGS